MNGKNKADINTKQSSDWNFIDDHGTFEFKNPQRTSYLYFPLVNQAHMMSSVTPTLNGDAKLDQNTFLLLPVSVEDLHNTRSARNFWVRINGEAWSVTGNSAAQINKRFSSLDENVTLQAGPLWHGLTREHPKTGLTANILNFVPANKDTVELMRVTLTNNGAETLKVIPTAAIPIFGRSADNLRDHRHVTALLHRTICHEFGVTVKPTMSFDERGHKINEINYAVLGVDGEGNAPVGFTPLIEDFIGEGGCLTWPKIILQDEPKLEPAKSEFEGFESIGGLHFSQVTLAPGESRSYILILGITSEEDRIVEWINLYGSNGKFENYLKFTRDFWNKKLSTLKFSFQQGRRDGWLKWVTLQPTLRQIMGNSFLPYHDYGRGGRGWRDLWQDLLALLITSQKSIKNSLVSNFAGIRMDGSNATIVGSSPGEFNADRNNIPRVWMDHGAWPLLTTKLYLDWTGDLHLLLEDQTYFRDHLSHRCQHTNPNWGSENETLLKSKSGEVVKGSILEHLIVQHLTVFFNVGEHNIIKLEGGDWNDGLDMAAERGESVAFSAMYAGNVQVISDLCLALEKSGVEEIAIAEELMLLLDRLSESIDYGSISAKQERLSAYFESVQGDLSGNKQTLSLKALSKDLREKANWLAEQIRDQEWITDTEGQGWFNGYYDNQGHRVEGVSPQGVRMTLTGQVFPLMAGIATYQQAERVVQTADRYLYDNNLNGYLLNTNFKNNPHELGRAFSFAYGHKENGAVFSHMAVMFAYALYKQDQAESAWKILDGLYIQSQNFEKSRMYPGIPEYFNPHGRGMYPYLTGSAAWYLFTLLTESFGIKGDLGDLIIEPKLVAKQFNFTEELVVKTLFAGKELLVRYKNPKKLGFGDYMIGKVSINGRERQLTTKSSKIQIPHKEISAWPYKVEIEIILE
ncbi:MAG: cellobiose phosphorylase [Brevefilum sp.]|nr:cellobiose phosphorylase [Brevefilum sp.]